MCEKKSTQNSVRLADLINFLYNNFKYVHKIRGPWATSLT